MNNLFYTKLPNRGLIHLEGADRHDFLQRIITNDMDFLQPGKALYSCLLTPQGKFLHDFFVTEGGNFTLIECESGDRARDLYKRLNMYRLRADVKISVEESVPVYAVFGAQPATAYPDPRHHSMGWRSFTKPENLPEKPFEVWDERRIRLTIPDGSRDMIPEKSTLLECRIDALNGLSYDKGCYVGQEPTARTHYRGLGKKHLYTVNMPEIKKLLSPRKRGSSEHEEKDSRLRGKDNLSGKEIRIDGKLIGEMRSSCGDVGLALLKDAEVHLMEKSSTRLADTGKAPS